MAEREAATAVTRRSQVLFAVPAPPHRQISLSPSRGSRRFEQRGPRHGCSPAAPHGALRGRAGREGAGAVPPSPQGRGCASGRRLSGCGGAPARPAGRFASPGRGGAGEGGRCCGAARRTRCSARLGPSQAAPGSRRGPGCV